MITSDCIYVCNIKNKPKASGLYDKSWSSYPWCISRFQSSGSVSSSEQILLRRPVSNLPALQHRPPVPLHVVDQWNENSRAHQKLRRDMYSVI